MDLRCPDDGHLLRLETAAPVSFAVCRHCYGLFFTAEGLARAHVFPPPVPEQSRRWRPVLPAPTRSCPACLTAMALRSLDGIQIDQCGTCAGIWLDPGEFDAARLRLRPSNARPVDRSDDGERGLPASIEVAELLYHLFHL